MKKILMVDSQENEVSTTEPEEDSTVSIEDEIEKTPCLLQPSYTGEGTRNGWLVS